MAKETISFRVEKEIIESIEAFAERLGTSKSNVAEMALTIFAEFDKDLFLKDVCRTALALGVSEAKVIQNVYIKSLARLGALKEVYGEFSEIAEEFTTVTDQAGTRMLTGADLYETLLNQYITEEKQR